MCFGYPDMVKYEKGCKLGIRADLLENELTMVYGTS